MAICAADRLLSRAAGTVLVPTDFSETTPSCDGRDPGDPGCVSAEDFALIEQSVEDGTPE